MHLLGPFCPLSPSISLSSNLYCLCSAKSPSDPLVSSRCHAHERACRLHAQPHKTCGSRSASAPTDPLSMKAMPDPDCMIDAAGPPKTPRSEVHRGERHWASQERTQREPSGPHDQRGFRRTEGFDLLIDKRRRRQRRRRPLHGHHSTDARALRHSRSFFASARPPALCASAASPMSGGGEL